MFDNSDVNISRRCWKVEWIENKKGKKKEKNREERKKSETILSLPLSLSLSLSLAFRPLETNTDATSSMHRVRCLHPENSQLSTRNRANFSRSFSFSRWSPRGVVARSRNKRHITKASGIIRLLKNRSDPEGRVETRWHCLRWKLASSDSFYCNVRTRARANRANPASVTIPYPPFTIFYRGVDQSENGI